MVRIKAAGKTALASSCRIFIRNRKVFQMIWKHGAAAVAAAALCGALALPAAAASSSAASSGSSSAPAQQHPPHGGSPEHLAWAVLSDLTGKTTAQLHTQYPQQTVWQAAKQAGKLDELKKQFLERVSAHLHRMQSEGALSAADTTAFYNELAQRVAKIDGEKTVTLGHPAQ